MDQKRPSWCRLPYGPRRQLGAPVSGAELARAIARGRQLQAEAARSGFRKALAKAVALLRAGARLRGFRYPAARRQPCC